MSLTRRIAHNTIIQVIGKVLGLLVGLFTIALLTRYLDKEGYGQYTTIIAFLQLFGIIADFGLYQILIQMISQPNVDINKVTSNIFTLRFLVILFFLIFACSIGFLIPAYPLKIKIGICLSSLIILFVSLNQIIVAVFQKYLKMAEVALGEFVGKVVNLALIILTFVFSLNFFFVLLSVVFSAAVNFLIVYLFSLKFVKINFRFDFSLWKEVLKRAWPIAFSIIFSMLYFKMDTIILSFFRSQAEVGIYGASYRIIEVLSSFPILFIGLIFPLLSQSWAINNLEYFKNILQKSFDFLIVIIVPLMVGGFILSEKIILLIAGPKFIQASLVFKILIFAVGFLFLGQLFSYAIIAIYKQKIMMWYYMATAIIGVIGYLIFIPKYSYYAAAGITVLTEFLIFLFSGFIVLTTIKSSLKLRIIWKTILSTLIMALFLYLFYSFPVLLLIVLGGFIYLVPLYLLKGYSKETLKEIINPVKSCPREGGEMPRVI